MRFSLRLAALGLLAALGACTTTQPVAPTSTATVASAEARKPVTILISIDGMRSDYLDRGITPVMSALAAEGVRAPMRPSFPSKTFPNHYALVTGQRPDRNGITANRMEDPEHPGETFTMASADSWWWDQATPIWVSAEQAGIRTATLFWPGSAAAVSGTRPHDWSPYDDAVSGPERIDRVIGWLRRPVSDRPAFIALYFEQVDSAGHDFGPDAPQTNAEVAEVDALIGQLRDRLAQLNQPANLILVSDHGMAATGPDRVIALDTVVRPEVGRALEDGPYATFYPAPGKDAELAALLLGRHDHYSCWRKGTIPARFHFGANPRVPPFLCLADTGWMIRALSPPADWQAKKGNHGWDNDAPEMRAVFIADGPAFAQHAALPLFDNVDVYPLLRAVIGLPPVTGIDGRDTLIKPVLRAR